MKFASIVAGAALAPIPQYPGHGGFIVGVTKRCMRPRLRQRGEARVGRCG